MLLLQTAALYMVTQISQGSQNLAYGFDKMQLTVLANSYPLGSSSAESLTAMRNAPRNLALEICGCRLFLGGLKAADLETNSQMLANLVSIWSLLTLLALAPRASEHQMIVAKLEAMILDLARLRMIERVGLMSSGCYCSRSIRMVMFSVGRMNLFLHEDSLQLQILSSA